MSRKSGAGAPRLNRIAALALLGLACLPLGGCVTMYVANGLPDPQPSDYPKLAAPAPVQMLFTWKTKGTVNTRAQDMVLPEVTSTVKQSGLFSAVGPEPAAQGALLSITIENNPISTEGEAVAKGFVTGFTFGLVGSQIAEGYTCTIEYSTNPGAAKLARVTRQILFGTLGAHGTPENSVKAPSIKEAVMIMTRRTVGSALKQLAADPAFGQ